MVKSLKYFHRASCFLAVVFIFSACQQNEVLYKKEYSDKEKLALSESLLNGAGTDLYYQGTVGERMIIKEGNSYNPSNAWGQRELGVPYLKRGFAHEAYKYYSKAVEADAGEWQGYMAYCWLYFYRDYKTALKAINAYDALTPNFVDYPQATSVDYMRGICYLKLGKHEEAIHFMKKHLDSEIKSVGPKYVDAMPYMLLGIAYYENGQLAKSDEIFRQGLKYNDNTADLYFYHTRTLYDLGKTEEAKEAIDKAEYWLLKGGYNQRPYVEEFYSIYKEDIEKWKMKEHLN